MKSILIGTASVGVGWCLASTALCFGEIVRYQESPLYALFDQRVFWLPGMLAIAFSTLSWLVYRERSEHALTARKKHDRPGP